MRLGLRKDRVREVLDYLKSVDLISESVEGDFCINADSSFNMAETDLATLKKASHEAIRVAQAKLDLLNDDLAYFSSNTFALSVARIDEATQIIRDFRQRFEGLFSSGDRDEVYKMNIQFFPLTEARKGT